MHGFFTFFIPWSNLSGAYVPKIYEQYTQEYIDLSVKKHKHLAEWFESNYHFVNNLRYCKQLFKDYRMPMLGHNDIFNLKFMLFDEYFKIYDKLTYIDFDVIHKGLPTLNDRKTFLNVDCAIHYTEPLPGKQIHVKTLKLCEIFKVNPNRMVWQNNNGVITISKDIWEKIGGFSEEFDPGFGSDPDLNMKLWNIGVRIFKGVNKSRVYHFGSVTTRKNNKVVRNKANKTFLLKWIISSQSVPL